MPPWCPLHPPGLDGRTNRDSPGWNHSSGRPEEAEERGDEPERAAPHALPGGPQFLLYNPGRAGSPGTSPHLQLRAEYPQVGRGEACGQSRPTWVGQVMVGQRLQLAGATECRSLELTPGKCQGGTARRQEGAALRASGALQTPGGGIIFITFQPWASRTPPRAEGLGPDTSRDTTWVPSCPPLGAPERRGGTAGLSAACPRARPPSLPASPPALWAVTACHR